MENNNDKKEMLGNTCLSIINGNDNLHRFIESGEATLGTLVSDLGWDSLDTVEFVIEVELVLEKQLDDGLIFSEIKNGNIKTVGDIVNIISND